MSFHLGMNGLDYSPWRLPGSRVDLRGPAVNTARPFMATLGSSEVFGRFVAEPFAASLGETLNVPVANLGVQNGGVDVFLQDGALMSMAAQAEIVVVQAMGAQNLSNRFYTVHPRRNDRFVRHSKLMQSTFRKADFSDFVFTRHMLIALKQISPRGFEKLLAELREAWIARMTRLVEAIPGKVVLLWIENSASGALGPEPLFVTPDMIDAIRDDVASVVHCDVGEMLGEVQLEEMQFGPGETECARFSLPPTAHEAVAVALVEALRPLIAETDLTPGAPARPNPGKVA